MRPQNEWMRAEEEGAKMRTVIWRCWIACVLLAGAGMIARADLDAYFRKPEPAYKWSLTTTDKRADGTVYDLQMTSQTWQNMDWKHRIQVFVPKDIAHPHFCALLNTGGNGGAVEDALGMLAAKQAQTVFAILYNIPNQPLYDGKSEDALVVYTWLKYIETGDESWPLHFPMAKAVLKAMDTVQALAKKERLPSIDSFLITGASKRGWTTWLAGASRDRRIKAIAPMVIDTLNLPAQVPHQLAAYGKPSEQVDDYTKADIFSKLNTPRGKRLVQLEDPYSYRDRLTLPKLLILGTNDRYWAQDALNFYWDGLKGPKWVLYTPNSGHGLEDRVRVINTLTAFIRSIASNQPWPKMQWKYVETAGGTQLVFRSDTSPLRVDLFHVSAPTQDFRDSKWTSEPMTQNGNDWTGRLSTPTSGYAAIFGEATYDLDSKPFTLSTQIHILGQK
jgi:PhoPQ-activated pathogenicity-related protein